VVNPEQFYSRVIAAVFASLHYARLDAFPKLGRLKEFFLYLPHLRSIKIKKRNDIEDKMRKEFDIQGFDASQLEEIATDCHHAFLEGATEEDFFAPIFGLPARFASAVGLKVIYLVDHCDVVPQAAKVITAQFKRCSFVATVKEQAEVGGLFDIRRVVKVFTQNCVDVPCDGIILIGSLRVGIAVTQGCPGWVASFLHICELLTQSAVSGREGAQLSKIETARKRGIVQEVKRLFLSLREASPEIITDNVLNDLTTGVVDVRLESSPSRDFSSSDRRRTKP
jgi:hypothetical protein